MKLPRFKPAVKAANFLDSMFPFDVKYFLKGGFWIGSSYAGTAVVRLLFIMIMAYAASKELYGQYQFSVTVFAIWIDHTATHFAGDS